MKKFLLITVMAGCAAATAFAARPANVPSVLAITLYGRIQPRSADSAAESENKRENKFLSPVEVLNRMGKEAADMSEKLDSIVKFDGQGTAGEKISKHVFSYNENGKPLTCLNYNATYDSTGEPWEYAGHYSYVYDNLGRIVEISTTTVIYGATYGEKRVFVYTEPGKPYTEDYYYQMNGTDEWEASQKAYYVYDDFGNTISQEMYYTMDNGENWYGQDKKTAEYDSDGWITHYYPYGWDWTNNAWVGSGNAQIFHYRADHQDEMVENLTWKDGKWADYYKTCYTYDDKNRVSKKEELYWSDQNQDWNGGDDSRSKNSYITYSYDDKGRCTEELGYSCKRGADPQMNFKRTREYTDLENQRTTYEEKVYYPLTSPELALYNHRTITLNRNGSEVYYLERAYNSNASGNGLWKKEEIVREIDDELNRYLQGTFYFYSQDDANIRYGDTLEKCEYDDNGNQTRTLKMKGASKTTDDQWVNNTDMRFGYSYDSQSEPVMTSYELYSFANGAWNLQSGWSQTYDFDADFANVWMFPIDNTIFSHKNIEDYVYSISGSTVSAYTDHYYYSNINGAGVDNAYMPDNVTEVARYNVAGQRLNAPVEGVNIVKYSDGSIRKVFVK